MSTFKKKIAKFVNSKGGKAAIIGSALFLLCGVAAFVLSYGLTDGWASVLAWFTSRWALLVYVGIGFYVLMLLYIVAIARKFED